MSESLLERLCAYSRSDFYPLHMPGHKRRLMPVELEKVCRMDITEIDGFDNLHDARGILAGAQSFAASLYGADETFFLVNGSSCGLLAAIASVCRPGSEILLSRGCHRAVYHAMEREGLIPRYLYPHVNRKWGILEGISAEDVRQALDGEGHNAQALVITSPTYEGVVSDIAGICRAAHEKGIPVIVDEAHGAHLHFSEDFPVSAVDAGADLIVQSCHKTLPALTQCALLHVCGSYVDRDRLAHMLRVYQTSSPSYLLMGSIDGCMRMLAESGDRLFEEYSRRLACLRRSLGQMKHLHLIGDEDLEYVGSCGYDPSKLAISCARTVRGGHWLYQLLLEKYQIQLEMETGSYVLGMTSIGDDDAGFARVRDAFLEADRLADEAPAMTGSAGKNRSHDRINEKDLPHMEAVMSPSQAFWEKSRSVSLKEAPGQISAAYVHLYPPGIPLLVPGERITSRVSRIIEGWERAGLSVTGTQKGIIKVIV